MRLACDDSRFTSTAARMTTTVSKKAQPRSIELQKEGVKHEYHPYPGDHSLSYFLSHFAQVMEFHSRAFGLIR